MSNAVEEKILAMRFDHSQFEAGVKSTIGALASLKQSLNMSGAKTSMGELQNAVNGVKIDRLSGQVDELSSRFTGLKAVALGALASIGAKVVDLGMDLGKKMVDNLTQSARDGFGEYETKLGSIQTILANTSKFGTSLGDVTKSLNELNEYSDKTIYNFGDMTRNIGLFTNAGLKLEESTSMIKGFSNAAAASGTTAQGAAGAAYQLSQALSNGEIRLMDWKSLTNVGMGNNNMKTGLIDLAKSMGTLTDKTVKGGVTANNFNETLEKGWLTSDVMSKYLQIMAGDMDDAAMKALGLSDAQIKMFKDQQKTAEEAATKVRSLSQLLGTLAESAGSGWAQTWEIVFGDFDEATKLFTEANDRLGAFVEQSAKARNEQIGIWDELGGRTAVIDGLRNILDAVLKVITPIKEAFEEVFPPSLGKNLATLSFLFRDLTKGLIISDGAAANLKMVATGLFKVLKFGVDVVGGIFKVIFTFVGIVLDLAGALFGLVTPFLTFVRGLLPVSEGAKEATSSVSSFFDLVANAQKFLSGGLIQWLRDAGKQIDSFLNDGSAQARVMSMVEALKGFGQAVASVWNILTKGDFTSNPLFAEDSPFASALFKIREVLVAIGSAFGKLGGIAAGAGANFSNFWTGVGDVIKKAWDYVTGIGGDIPAVLSAMATGIGNLFANIDIEQVLAAVNTGVLIAVALAIKKVLNGFGEISEFKSNFLNGITDSLDGLTGVLGAMQTKLKADALLKIAIAIGVLAASLVVLSFIDPDRLLSAVTGLGTAFAVLMGALLIVSKIGMTWGGAAKLPLIMIAMMQMASALLVLSLAVKNLGSMSWDELIRGMAGLSAMMLLLVGSAVLISKFGTQMTASAAGMLIMAAAITALAGAVAIFGLMPIDVLIQGGIAVGAILAGLVGSAVLLAQFAPKMVLSAVGLMAMAAAINMLIVPLTTLGLLPIPILTQGMFVLALLLGGLVLASNLLSTSAPKMAMAAVGMMAMAAAVNLMIAPITILGSLGIETLIQGLIGLAAVMVILVVAANAMTGALTGAAGMIALAAAVLILSVALKVLSTIPMEAMVLALVALAAVFLIIGVAAYALTPVTPVLLALAAALLAVGIAMILMAATIAVFALGLMLLGPALLIAGAGLMAFAQIAPKIAEQVPAFLAIGAGLLVFGAGALVAGAGIAVLGLGLVLLGAGLALVALFGVGGATALTYFVLALGKLSGEMPNMLAMAGTFTVLGAAVLVLGAGMVVLGAGAILVAVGLALLVPLGFLVTASFALITAAIERLLPQTANMGVLSVVFGKLGASVAELGANGLRAAAGLAAIVFGMMGISVATILATSTVTRFGPMVQAGMRVATNSVMQAQNQIRGTATQMQITFNTLAQSLNGSIQKIITSMRGLGQQAGPAAASSIRSQSGNLGSAGQSIGTAVTDGMARGIRNGQSKVTSAARSVAAAALAASKDELGVHSPSREYAKIGEFNDDGMALGMYGNMGVVSKAARAVGGAAIDELQASLNGQNAFDIDTIPTIRPVVDLSDVNAAAGRIDGMFGARRLDLQPSVANAQGTQAAIADTEQLILIAQAERDEESGATHYTQNIYSPKAVSDIEVYRQTKNQLNQKKKGK